MLGYYCFLAWLSVLVVESGQAVERNVPSPFALQFGQFAHQFEPDLFMALGARRKNLSPNERYFVRQPMLRVNDPVNSAFGDDVRALEK